MNGIHITHVCPAHLGCGELYEQLFNLLAIYATHVICNIDDNCLQIFPKISNGLSRPHSNLSLLCCEACEGSVLKCSDEFYTNLLNDTFSEYVCNGMIKCAWLQRSGLER